MTAYLFILRLLDFVITWLLRVGRAVAFVAIGVMVLIILVQVVARYVFNNALPWPDEAARFLMLWMTALVAPSAYRWGGFVSIDMIKEMFGRRLGLILDLFLLVLALAVLVFLVRLGMNHVSSGWLFASSSLKIPLDLVGLKSIPVKLAWMYMSLPIGFALMLLVNIEMVLKCLHMLADPEADYSSAPDQLAISAE